MFLKLAAISVTMGAFLCGLLAMRQSRLQAAHELAQVQLRIRQHDEQLWALRSRIAAKVTPEAVQQMASELGELRPLLAEPVQPEPGSGEAGQPTPRPKPVNQSTPSGLTPERIADGRG